MIPLRCAWPPACGQGGTAFPRTGFEAYTTEPPDGTFLWTRDTIGAPPQLRLRLNTHLASVSDDVGRDTLFHYRAANGKTYTARLILPAGYEPGRRYPLIVWVYPGRIYADTLPRRSKPHYVPAFLELHLWATHGYAVLMPSIGPSEGNPVVDMKGFVLPPIDTLIASRLVDSARVGLLGHSHGGLAVYALITTTSRFHAAVALSGWADITSYYGAFNADYCYCAGDFSNEWAATGPVQFESSRFRSEWQALRIGNTPWGDPVRWAANNPIDHFDRITTPLMIVHGDNDFFYMSDADIAFTSLNRLGKRVRYVRYWGEGHVIESPANIRDLWIRMFAWFDGYLHPSVTERPGRRSLSHGRAGLLGLQAEPRGCVEAVLRALFRLAALRIGCRNDIGALHEHGSLVCACHNYLPR